MFKFFKFNLFFVNFLMLNYIIAMDSVSKFSQDVIETSSKEIKNIFFPKSKNRLTRTKSFNDLQEINNFEQRFNDLNRSSNDWYEKLKAEHMRRYYNRNKEKNIFRRMR